MKNPGYATGKILVLKCTHRTKDTLSLVEMGPIFLTTVRLLVSLRVEFFFQDDRCALISFLHNPSTILF